MNTEIGVDTDQVRVESCVMEFSQRQAVRDCRLPKLLVGVHDDVSSIEESWLR